ncbi:MAG: hypothetical protein Q4G27_02810 [Flavobacteriaceae bacterium]|nr:hypothetical protein [Flavobacteriaceae bacterium]
MIKIKIYHCFAVKKAPKKICPQFAEQNKNNSWRHFEVHINSILNNKIDFDKTTDAYKDFSQGAARNYLQRMTSYITDRLPNMNPNEFKSNTNIQNAIKFLQKSIDTYNSIYGENMKMFEFEKLNQKMHDERYK